MRLTEIPTATGREQRVVAFIREWVSARPDLRLKADGAGNLVVSLGPARRGARGKAGSKGGHPPLFITAHLDHPAFVVERVDAGGRVLELSFRGGVNDVFFDHAPITVYTADNAFAATLTGEAKTHTPAGKHYLAELDTPLGQAEAPRVGDIATWALPGSEIDSDGVLHAPVCDDLAAAAAAAGGV